MRATVVAICLASTAGCGPTRVSPGGRFATLASGTQLPSETDCAQRVRRSGFEPRPVNGAVNHSVPTSAQLQGYNTGSWTGYADPALAMHARVTGNFTGTTDELIQWAACKWGFDEDVVRAQAQTESNWYQRGGVAGQGLGDYTRDMSLCPPGTWDGQGCFQSYGLLQAKYIYSQSAWPMIRDDTAFNLDFVYGWRRACFEGHITWLHQAGTPGYPDYAAGDLWGCVGQWFSGGWYDGGAIAYIGTVRSTSRTRTG